MNFHVVSTTPGDDRLLLAEGMDLMIGFSQLATQTSIKKCPHFNLIDGRKLKSGLFDLFEMVDTTRVDF